MALPVTIPNQFANATASIPLSQLDTNFTTLANAVNGISDGSETLANVTATVANITTANVGALNTSGQVVFNDAGADVDFRVESDTVDHALFVEGSSGNVGIGRTNPGERLSVQNTSLTSTTVGANVVAGFRSNAAGADTSITLTDGVSASAKFGQINGSLYWMTSNTERMRIDSSGNVGIGTTTPSQKLDCVTSNSSATAYQLSLRNTSGNNNVSAGIAFGHNTVSADPDVLGAIYGVVTDRNTRNGDLRFSTAASATLTERARITSGGVFLINNGITTDPSLASGSTPAGARFNAGTGSGNYALELNASATIVGIFNRTSNDGVIVEFKQDATAEGTISVSGNTVSYNAFAGSHWSQLQQGRGYNPDIPRGTVMSTIGEMCEWKSVEWTETTEHPAIPAVEAKEAVLDEEGNVIEPAVEAVEGKDAWTETSDKRESYLGQLPVGATFEEDGFTKTVVDDGNERLPKVKISDVVGDKAVYGVFQTWDEAQDMLVTSLGAFVVRIAAGVTVEIGDLLESNGDGCAKVQDDDVIRSKTIAKVTSTTPTATYDDGSYTVPAVIYCG